MKRLWLVLLLACTPKPYGTLPDNTTGSCAYTNSFSNRVECRDYLGAWDVAQAKDDCSGWKGTFTEGTGCDTTKRVGFCVLGGDGGTFTRVTFPGDDKSQCGGSKTGCEVFGGGTFEPAAICGGAEEDVTFGTPTFQQPIKTCAQRDGKEICTWEMISGVTALGYDFEEFASCDRVRTQRPYHAAKTEDNAEREDPRLQDPEYAADLSWLKEQVTSAACVCCHSSRAPEGPSNWYLESPGNFLNSFYGSGLAMGAGWINSVGFGTYPPEENNGFSRASEASPEDSIFPTTDPARMKRIFERELASRGLTRADFADQPYAAGPLDEQRFFRPKACAEGEGVKEDGSIAWKGGRARYLYVLESDAASPTVPPNLDLPTGTKWRIDVPADGEPVRTGEVFYGVVPEGRTQRFPEASTAEPLVSGRSYYLYVTADVAIPVTRCLFIAP